MTESMDPSVRPSLADQRARETLRTVYDRSFFVEASAGAGKTTVLVDRIVGLVRTGTTKLSRLVAVTFTEKAAGEMKLRLRSELERVRLLPELRSDERERILLAIHEFERAHIGTIHGLCVELLREHPLEAGVDPRFTVADEAAIDRLLEEAFRPYFEAQLAKPGEGIGRLLRRRGKSDDGGPFLTLLRSAKAVTEYRDHPAHWKRPSYDRAKETYAAFQKVVAFADMARTAHTPKVTCWLHNAMQEFLAWSNERIRREQVRGPDLDALEQDLRDLLHKRWWDWSGSWSPKEFSDTLSKAEVKTLREKLRGEIREVVERNDADLAACLQHDLLPFVPYYEAVKTRRGTLDFLDLLLKTRDLLVGHAHVRSVLRGRYDAILVDEFQDTDPLQAQILLLLASTDTAETDEERLVPIAGKWFSVGDPKQAIYRFRRADVALYSRIKTRLVSSGAAELVHLTTCFRSQPALQQFVNAVFGPQMQETPDGSQASYVPLTGFRKASLPIPNVVALPVPNPYSDAGYSNKQTMEDSYADAVGAFVRTLLSESKIEIEEAGVKVPLEARHICILFRRFQGYQTETTKPYVRALEARRIPHVLLGGRSFFEREEIAAFRNVLHAIEWPSDDFALYATLRGPFLGFQDDLLFAFRGITGTLHPFSKRDGAEREKSFEPILESLQCLADLHRKRNQRPIAETMGLFLEWTRAHALLASWPHGERALGNIARLIEMARGFERDGAVSFRGFLDHLVTVEERGSSEAVVVEEGADGVRLMTVHRAKGLEFPVVILADLQAPPHRSEPSRYSNSSEKLFAFPLAWCSPLDLVERRGTVLRHDAEEGLRLSYVAATRARDMLVVPVLGDDPHGLGGKGAASWCDTFKSGLYPKDAERKSAKGLPPGFPVFGRSSVLPVGEKVRRSDSTNVQPGIHRPKQGDHEVVWWDPNTLALQLEEEHGVLQRSLFAEPSDPLFAAKEGEAPYKAWVERRERILRDGAVSQAKVRTVTRIKTDLGNGAEWAALGVPTRPCDVIVVPRIGSRPKGKQFGTFVHAILNRAPFSVKGERDKELLRGIAHLEGSLFGVPGQEIDSAIDLLGHALQHPFFESLGDAQELRREVNIVYRTSDAWIEGVVDLAYKKEGVWWVVDYKTDDSLETRMTEYIAQLSLYGEGIARATGLDVRCALVHL